VSVTTYRTTVRHTREAPVANRFRYRASAWLVDLADLPRLPRGLRWLAAFEARDHLGESTESIGSKIERLLAGHDVDVAGGRILMLANARAFGHVFNPISIHWCHAADGKLAAVVAEVHNTYGDRHAYVLRPDPDGRVDHVLDKQMYVSPFNAVTGDYRITVTPPGERVGVSVTLVRPGQPPFVATLTGDRRETRSVLPAAMSTAGASLRVSALIRWQGIRLFLRGLHVEPRPIHARQEAVG
jgi:DUF1365 family protein